VVSIVLLGKLADLGGASALRLAGPLDWAGLKAALPAALAEVVDDPKNRVALNGVLLVDKAALQAGEGDEVALLPPVSGG
jgi:molybdopterin synthase sulfur carrier subunit